ncbi:MAG: hypothetical protein JWN25_2159 [Verrucomicrobiales bacterium]|nr:hypothetical protein [Verrucomicrobiales bacterium]MDB6130212.1 hypothetical protein [Verrucomicrobiales bacterium]
MKHGMLTKVTILAALLISMVTVSAQMPGEQAMKSMSFILPKLVGSNTNFTSTTSVQVLEGGLETMALTMNFALSDGKIKTDLDMANMKSSSLPPEIAVQLKSTGMDKLVSIVRPDKKVIYLVYPNLSAYTELPIKQEELEAMNSPQIEKKDLGKETVEGHPCTKQQVTVTTGGTTQVITVWNASDLKNFPVKMQAPSGASTVVMTYKNIQFVKTKAEAFDPAPSFMKYDMAGFQALLMKKMMGQ